MHIITSCIRFQELNFPIRRFFLFFFKNESNHNQVTPSDARKTASAGVTEAVFRFFLTGIMLFQPVPCTADNGLR